MSLFFIGFLIFGPVTLIGICVIGFAPKTATVVVNAVPRAFGYIFGDSMAKVMRGYIADPKKKGINILGYNLHGWDSTFMVLIASAVVGLACLLLVALFEEYMIRADRAFAGADGKDGEDAQGEKEG